MLKFNNRILKFNNRWLIPGNEPGNVIHTTYTGNGVFTQQSVMSTSIMGKPTSISVQAVFHSLRTRLTEANAISIFPRLYLSERTVNIDDVRDFIGDQYTVRNTESMAYDTSSNSNIVEFRIDWNWVAEHLEEPDNHLPLELCYTITGSNIQITADVYTTIYY